MRDPECVQAAVREYFDKWRPSEPDLPYGELEALLESIVVNHPSALAIATNPRFASKTMLVIDTRTAPREIDIGWITGILNSGMVEVRAACPDTAGVEFPLAEPPASPLLSWPSIE